MSAKQPGIAPGDLPPKAARMLVHVYESQLEAGKSKAVAASSAWCTVERHYVRGKGGRWRKRAKVLAPVGADDCPSPSQAKSKRAENPQPSLAQLGTMSEHGRVHELQVEHADGRVESHSWSGAHRPVLLWSPKQRALVFVHGVKLPRPSVGHVPRDDGAAATFERFFGKRTMASREFTLPAVKMSELGRGVFVAYWTPLKWRKRVAEHKLGPRVRVWMGSAGGRKVYAVAGGNLRMTARGIEG